MQSAKRFGRGRPDSLPQYRKIGAFQHSEKSQIAVEEYPNAMSDWTILCARRLRPNLRDITHVGVTVPRGTQHVPVAEAIASIKAGEHRFYIDNDGDLLLVRVEGNVLVTRFGATLTDLIDALPDCGEGPQFLPPATT